MAKQRGSSYFSIAQKVLLQPWFLPKRVACAIHALVPPDFYNKMRYCFDDYGCIVCEKESNYFSNGMCKPCFDRTKRKLVQSVKRRLKSNPAGRLDIALFRQERLAKKLLGRFAGSHRRPSRKSRIDISPETNPIYELLGARPEYLAALRARRVSKGIPQGDPFAPKRMPD
jgi:hypothetical protein